MGKRIIEAANQTTFIFLSAHFFYKASVKLSVNDLCSIDRTKTFISKVLKFLLVRCMKARLGFIRFTRHTKYTTDLANSGYNVAMIYGVH